jgi:hypothetical protein
MHELWQDPFGLYTTLLVGINTERGFFVGAGPVLHSPTRLFISLEFKQHHVDEILEHGWYTWERERAEEEHLLRHLRTFPEIRSCSRLAGDGPDLSAHLLDERDLTIECKNVLRKPDREGFARLDFQRTRAAKSDPCSRYYSPTDFDVVAACLHAVTEKWEFRFAVPGGLEPHATCPGKLSSNVHVDSRWSRDPLRVLRAAAALR